MNNSFSKLMVCGATAASLLWVAAATAADNVNTNATGRPLAAFVDDPRQGRDPFFPESTRRLRNLVPVGTNSPVLIANHFALKGISGSKLQPLALINNATLGPGESAEIRSSAGTFKIRCREIRDRSVLIEIDGTGEVRELRLREGI